jgi:hypothetical protein
LALAGATSATAKTNAATATIVFFNMVRHLPCPYLGTHPRKKVAAPVEVRRQKAEDRSQKSEGRRKKKTGSILTLTPVF